MLKFVLQPQPGQSQRDKELQRAERLSHAAKVSHRKKSRRQEQLPKTKDFGSHVCDSCSCICNFSGFEFASFYSRTSLHGGSDPIDDCTINQTEHVLPFRQISTNPAYSLNATILESILPTDSIPLTYDEKTTLWNYFGVAPTAYGTTGSGPFCPFRDISFPSCHRYPQALQWMLIAAERQSAARQRLPEPRSLILRKANAYKAISNLLQDESIRYSDEALVVVIGAIVIESRFLDVKVTKMHVRGLEALIQKRGGLASLFHSSSVMYHPLFLLGYLTAVPSPTSTQQELDACRSTFTRSLRDIKNRNQQFHRHLSREEKKSRAKQDCYPSTHDGVPPDSLLKQYIEARRLTFSSPAFGLYITLPPATADETFYTKTSRFIVLYLLNLILWRYSPSPSYYQSTSPLDCFDSAWDGRTRWFSDAIAFLTTLNHSMIHSGEINSQTKTSSIRMQFMPWIIAKAWVDTDPIRVFSKEGQHEELDLTQKGISGIKVFAELAEEKRAELLGLLSAWLLDMRK